MQRHPLLGIYRVLPSFSQAFVSSYLGVGCNFTRFYRIVLFLSSLNGLYLVVFSFVVFYLFAHISWALRCSLTWIYRVVPSFTGFQRGCPGAGTSKSGVLSSEDAADTGRCLR